MSVVTLNYQLEMQSASIWIAGWNSNTKLLIPQYLTVVNSCQIYRTLSTYFYETSSRNSVSVIPAQMNVFLKKKQVSYTGDWLRCCKRHKDIFASLRAMAWQYKEMCQKSSTSSYYIHCKYCRYFLCLLSPCPVGLFSNLESKWVLYLSRRRWEL